MKDSSKAIIVVVVGLMATVSVAFVFMPYVLPPLQQFTDRILNPEPEPTTEPESTPSPEPETEPESTPEPSSPPLSTSKNITISYSVKKADSITNEYSYDVQSDSGKDFLIVYMTIKNNGYDSFSTNPYFFYVIADNLEYGFDYHLVFMEKWDTIDVLDGGTFHGTLVFQILESASSFTLDYDSFLSDYNIVWNGI